MIKIDYLPKVWRSKCDGNRVRSSASEIFQYVDKRVVKAAVIGFVK